jgi:hypothetical protein
MSVTQQRLFQRALIGVYAAIPLAVSLGTYMGWLFNSSSPRSGSTNIVTVGLISLFAATILAEHLGVFARQGSGRDLLKAAGYWLGAFVWIFAVMRVIPDNRTGATVLIGPISALMLAGMFHLARFAGTWTRFVTTTMMTATPVAVAPPTSGSPTSQGLPDPGAESARPGRLDISANVAKIALKLVGGAVALLVLARVLRGTSYDQFNGAIFYAGAILIGALALRSLSSRGPALSLASDGISLRRDMCPIGHIAWPQIMGFEMKSTIGTTYLVIQVKDANDLIAKCGPISRWTMGQSLTMFGSPVRIPIAWLKCDPNWLWQRANEMLMANRAPGSAGV